MKSQKNVAMTLFRKDKTAPPPILQDYDSTYCYKYRIGEGTRRAADSDNKLLVSLITVTLNKKERCDF